MINAVSTIPSLKPNRERQAWVRFVNRIYIERKQSIRMEELLGTIKNLSMNPVLQIDRLGKFKIEAVFKYYSAEKAACFIEDFAIVDQKYIEKLKVYQKMEAQKGPQKIPTHVLINGVPYRKYLK